MPQAIQINRRSVDFTYAQEFLTQDVAIDLAQIPAGKFMMGSPADEEGRADNGQEGPQHLVNISSFWMGQYPITQEQWEVVSRLPEVDRFLHAEPSYFSGKKRPVEHVSWYEAIEFCNRLTSQTKRRYRLPTEAEWEYACRAETTTPFHFGLILSPDFANYRVGPGQGAKSSNETTEVDFFKVANKFGLCDMHGNVWEWCLDHQHNTYNEAPINGREWLTDNPDTKRILRGGSWNYAPKYCRSASRDYSDPVTRYDDIGFRVVIDVR